VTQKLRTMVQCGDHGQAPGGIVCHHLVSGQSRGWLSACTGPGSEHDWICPDCAERIKEVTKDELRLVCVHCIRALRAQYDPNYGHGS
jgi:hypothetical protein